jgi:hypothetical protein
MIAFLIKTFMREDALIRLCDSIKTNFSDFKIYIADDSELNQSKLNFYDELTAQGHKIIFLPFDVGLSAGRNALMRQVKERYYVLCDDDYLFTADNGVFGAIKKLGKADLIAGTLYTDDVKTGAEYNLEIKDKMIIKTAVPGKGFRRVDMGLNFFVAEKRFYWDENLKINEEHIDFFLSRKQEGVNVYHDPDLKAIHDVRTQPKEYREFRERRNKQYLFEKWGVNKIKEGYLYD